MESLANTTKKLTIEQTHNPVQSERYDLNDENAKKYGINDPNKYNVALAGLYPRLERRIIKGGLNYKQWLEKRQNEHRPHSRLH